VRSINGLNKFYIFFACKKLLFTLFGNIRKLKSTTCCYFHASGAFIKHQNGDVSFGRSI